MRKVILRDYEKEIDATYLAVENSSSSDIEAPKEWTEEQTTEYITKVVTRVLKADKIGVDDDIFGQHGADRSVHCSSHMLLDS